MSNSGDGNGKAVHILAFPFPAPGHVIPMIDLTKLLLTRGISVTVLVTPRHLHLLEPLLKSHPSSAIDTLVLSPPEVPPSCTTYNPVARMNALAELYDPILQWFRSRPSPPVAILSDFLLGWTNRLTSDIGVPRIVFWTTGAASVSSFNWLYRDLTVYDIHRDDESVLSLSGVPNSHKYPWWQLSQLLPNFQHGDPGWAFFLDSLMSNVQSWGAVINSFDELERVYVDHLMQEMGHDRVWTVGPLLPSDDDQTASSNRGGSSSIPVDEVMRWLNSKPDNSVVYVCFGSRWTITDQQVAALAGALECSGVNFIWVVKEGVVLLNGFEERVERRGFIIKGWAPQVPILNHRAVGTFVSHCGWNSTLEALTAGVLMLTWPLGADQFFNAKLLVDELGVAVRFCDDGDRAVPDSAGLARLLGEWVGGARPVRLMELCRAATEALKAGGNSSKGLEMLVQVLRSLN
ncbi:flavonol 3-O-glucosyltransferase UGT89B1-like [Diospyros lotus]|uniref:flavonol 3-O-glucosyltransferase UGT89B1-like n=1 Tax=Diospyros lotus TaxID=55363 RepID=UPI0022592C7C|nr:flavonol 3-O-glucosyltransferase UGT89B1-like [Diospyros lotus]